MALPGGTSDRVLLVEGQDDDHVIRHLCDRSGLVRDFSIVQKGGFSELLRSIPVELAAPGRSALGVVVDANDNPAARWQAVRDRCERRGITLPSEPDPGGVVVEGRPRVGLCLDDAPITLDGAPVVVEGRPRVGLWLMPDNKSPGQLEDLVAAMIPAEDVIWRLAQDFVDRIPEPERPRPVIKAQVHAWLAARAAARPMGSAIGTGHLDAVSPAATSLIGWLKRLFHDSATSGTAPSLR